MLQSIKKIASTLWEWRYQVIGLAWFDIKKTCRGAVFGWLWIAIKPIIYITVFWFALGIGLRAESTVGDYPYILWLASGIIPWFFMSDLIVAGSNLYSRYPYLVNKIKFPVPLISVFYALSVFFVHAILMVVMLLVCLIAGVELSIHLIQLPILMIVMCIFFMLWSIMSSPISAVSKDFMSLIRALSTPLFWISGIIFNLSRINIAWLHVVFAFNPVYFFVSSYRAAICDKFWIWERPELFIPFLIVFVGTLLGAVVSYRRLVKVIPDVL